MDTNYYRKL